MKKINSLVMSLSSTIILALSGCGGGSSSTPTDTGSRGSGDNDNPIKPLLYFSSNTQGGIVCHVNLVLS